VDIDHALAYNAALRNRSGEAMTKKHRTLTVPDKVALGWGKLRRAFLITCRPQLVRRNLARRVGQCNRTGACCRLMVECPALGHNGEVHLCTTYLHRGPSCSIFPIDARDLRDRDRIMPDLPCGFRFLSEEEFSRAKGNGTGNGNGSAHHAFPWEIDGNALGGKVRRTNAFSMSCAFLRTAWAILRESDPGANGRKQKRSLKFNV
jgi:hypothetical protein